MSEKTACIFNIQKFSLHDGPGIRTVVFFKGCPLKCKWCSNPESQTGDIQLTWDEAKCVNCQKCIDSCPNTAIYKKDKLIYVDSSKCTLCRSCIKVCSAKALATEGRSMDKKMIINEVLKDKDFYDESGGGVTLSGGEVLMQAEFAIELLKNLKELGIHTACETTGYADKGVFLDFISNIDLILFDIKHYDSEAHIRGTGISNEKILNNLKQAFKKNKEIVIRIPVIPGFNDSTSDADNFCKLFKQMPVKKVGLLPFHQFGQKKYDLLGITYEMANIKQLYKEDLVTYKAIFERYGYIVE